MTNYCVLLRRLELKMIFHKLHIMEINFTGIFSHVSFQVALLLVTIVTERTLIRLLSGIGSHVLG